MLGSLLSLCLEVLNGCVRLAWTDLGAIEFMERADLIGIDITYDMLEEAVSEAGGAIDSDGRYPISETICQKLWKLLNTK